MGKLLTPQHKSTQRHPTVTVFFTALHQHRKQTTSQFHLRVSLISRKNYFHLVATLSTRLFNILCDKTGRTHEAFLQHRQMCRRMNGEPKPQLFHGTRLLPDRTTDNGAQRAWGFGRYFSKVNWASFLFQRQQQIVIYCQWSNLSFQVKIGILETASVTVSLTASQYLKTLLMRVVNLINECGFLTVSQLCQYLGVLHNAVNQYFPTDQWFTKTQMVTQV